MEEYRIIDDMSHEKYLELLDIAIKHSDAFSLTTFKGYHKKNLLPSYFETLNFLKPYKAEDLDYEYPKHYERGQKINLFYLTTDTVKLFYNVNGLYEWLPPMFPEDLSFYSDRKVWLSSISHEKLCFLYDVDESVISKFNDSNINVVKCS